MADDDEDIAALVVDNGSGMCKGALEDSNQVLTVTHARRIMPECRWVLFGMTMPDSSTCI